MDTKSSRRSGQTDGITAERRQQLAAEARAAAESFAGAGAELDRMAAENEVWLAEFEKRYEEINEQPQQHDSAILQEWSEILANIRPDRQQELYAIVSEPAATPQVHAFRSDAT
jgi:hypothetical protein